MPRSASIFAARAWSRLTIVRVLRRDVVPLADVGLEIVEPGREGLAGAHRGRRAQAFALRRNGQLPRTGAHGLEGVAGKVIMSYVRGLLRAAQQQGRQVLAINLVVCRHTAAGQFDEGGQEIEVRRHRVNHCAGGHLARPPCQRRLAHAPFVGAAFAATQRAGHTRIGALLQPGAVVAGEEDERALGKPSSRTVSSTRPTLQSTSSTQSL